MMPSKVTAVPYRLSNIRLSRVVDGHDREPQRFLLGHPGAAG